MAARELSSLVVEAPTYRENLLQKIATLRGPLGSVGRAADAVSDLGAELDKPTPGENHERVAAKVEVVARSPLLERLAGIVSPVADVLGAAAIVAVLAVFMLLQREDLRDRVIRLIGNRDLTLTTTRHSTTLGKSTRMLQSSASEIPTASQARRERGHIVTPERSRPGRAGGVPPRRPRFG